MNRKEAINLKSIPIDLNNRKSENTISEKLPALKDSGEKQINLEIKNLPEQENQNFIIDTELFSKIKDIQELPDWVIIKFLLSKGKLINSDFNDRILNG